MAASNQIPGVGLCREARENSQAQSDAVRQTAGQPKHRPEREAVTNSEEDSVSDGARQSPQRSVFAAQQIVG